jgi:hypothetical protein
MSTSEPEDETIREVSHEEYQRLRYQIMDCRRKRIARRLQDAATGLFRSQQTMEEEGFEIGHRVWQMRKQGRSLREISKSLRIPEQTLKPCLQEFEQRTMLEVGRAIEHFRALDTERLEDLMEAWLPIATGGPLKLERERDGMLVTELDYDRPMKASFIVLKVVETRIKLMLASQPDKSVQNETNVMVWLQQVMPQVSQAVRNVEAAPEPHARQVLELTSSVEDMGE